GGCMIRKLIGLATALALPILLAAQTPTIPNGHASPKGQTMAGPHSQSAQHRATQRRGEVAGGLSNRPSSIATPAVGRAVPAAGGLTLAVAPPPGRPPPSAPTSQARSPRFPAECGRAKGAATSGSRRARSVTGGGSAWRGSSRA